MFCPYCQHAVTRHSKIGNDDDHRWCFIHLLEHKLIAGTTPEEMHDAFYALCTAHVPPKAKPRKVKLTPEQRNATVPGPMYW
jgi:hypothetical protein